MGPRGCAAEGEIFSEGPGAVRCRGPRFPISPRLTGLHGPRERGRCDPEPW
ncbi:hypothetical protein SANTM175S_05449 [Streptomyces antimycoticus]